MSKKSKAEKRAAEIEAELQRRAEKKAAKAAKKKKAAKGKEQWKKDPLPKPEKASKKKGKKSGADAGGPTPPALQDIVKKASKMKGQKGDEPSPETDLPPEQIIAAANKVLAEGGSEGAMESARAAIRKAHAALKPPKTDQPDSTADAKARIASKKQLREQAQAELDGLDRDDDAAVARFNEVYGDILGHYATSNAESAERSTAVGNPATLPVDDAKPAKKPKKLKAADVVAAATEAIDAVEAEVEQVEAQVAEQVETEQGREFVVGSEQPETAVADDFAKPSDAPLELEEGRNGYKIAMLNEAGEVDRKKDGTFRTIRQYTRATTYIANLEDTTMLQDWKHRSILGGIVTNEDLIGAGREQLGEDLITSKIRDVMHVREVALAQAHKRDRKGKLEVGQLGELVADAEREYKKAMKALAELALEAGKANEKREKGTELHALCEVYDRQGIAPVKAMLDAEEITPADFMDVMAYAEKMTELGIEVDRIEQVVVDDRIKVAGRLDRTALVKLPGRARRVRVVADVKTGNIEFGQGKLAQQLDIYANAKAYDLETGEREDMKLDKRVGLVIHLPAGKAKCSVYMVDLVMGHKGNGISADVRAWRSESRHAVDFEHELGVGLMVTDSEGEVQ